jgi:predicted DNA-binding transcriptional regulator YafY
VRAEAKNMANEDLGDGATREPQPDGSILVRFACTNPEYLISRVLAAKGGLLVRAPERMRARVRDELERVRARHESGS